MGADVETRTKRRGPGPWLRSQPLTVASAGFVVLGLPVVWRGALLADDFANCLRPIQEGLGPTLASSWERLGAIRLARFVEILLTTGVCQRLPFGVAIAVPLALTVVVAWLLRGFLRDLEVPRPWPDLAGALWLLQPLGTEAALWPAALHVPLGLACALGSLRLLHRGRLGWGTVAAIGAFVSAEQTILALPVLTAVTAPPHLRRRTAAAALAGVVMVAIAFFALPGEDLRLHAGVAERLRTLANDPAFYVQFPAVGVGAQSIPLGILWGLPWSVGLLALGAGAGWRLGPHRHLTQDPRPSRTPVFLTGLVLVAAANAPVVLNVPRQGSPRIFTPTWLLLAALLALLASRSRWRYPRLAGLLAGVYCAGAVLSLMLSVWVRLTSAEVVEDVATRLAAQTVDGDVVALCDVPRSVAAPAPRGAFAVQDFLYDWAATGAVAWHTQREVTVHVAERGCPAAAADLVVDFARLTPSSHDSGSPEP